MKEILCSWDGDGKLTGEIVDGSVEIFFPSGEERDRFEDFVLSGRLAECFAAWKAEPVKHGHWVGHWENDAYTEPGKYRCSWCGGEALTDGFNDNIVCSDFCPHCGAKMDEEVEE